MNGSLIRRAYSIIGRLTPIPADCGRLCGSICCRGGSNEGMLLFPGEEALLLRDPHFKIVRTKLNDKPAYMAVCHGSCLRSRRPLSCRIFPFSPYLEDNGLRVVPDVRAKLICPLLSKDYSVHISFDYLSALKRAFCLLASDPDIKEFLKDYKIMQDGYSKFIG